MTPFKPFARLVFALVLSISISAALLPRPIAAQQSAPSATAADYTTQLAAIEKTIDDKRKELGIPGLSLVIVKDDISNGDIVMRVTDVKFDVDIPDTVFRKPATDSNKVNAN